MHLLQDPVWYSSGRGHFPRLSGVSESVQESPSERGLASNGWRSAPRC